MKLFSSSAILHLLVCVPAAVSSTNIRKIGNKKDDKAATLATRGLWQHPINPGYDLHCPCLKQAMAELSAGMSQALTKADFTLLSLLQPQEDLADVLQEIASQGMDCLGRLVNCQQTTDSEECCCDAETLKGAFLAQMNTVASYKKINPDGFYGAMRVLTEDCFGFPTVPIVTYVGDVKNIVPGNTLVFCTLTDAELDAELDSACDDAFPGSRNIREAELANDGYLNIFDLPAEPTFPFQPSEQSTASCATTSSRVCAFCVTPGCEATWDNFPNGWFGSHGAAVLTAMCVIES